MHLESVEPRRLMASTGLDPTFGTNGIATLPGVTLGDAVLSVPGGYFVEAKGKTDKADYLYKLTTTGQVDSTWGNNGRVATPYFGVDTLAYDKRYNLLYAAGVTKRFTVARDDANGNTATLRIQRFDGASGHTDTTFGDNGVASFAYGVSNRTVVHRIDIGRLQPLVKRGLAVAFEHTSYQASADYFGDSQQTNDVTLLKYNADGTRNAAFGRRGIGNVSSGYHNYDYGNLTDTQQFDDPDFEDLQTRDDGSFRVITSHRRGSSTYTNDDEGAELVNDLFLVKSQVFGANGAVDASQEHVWRVAKTVPSDYQSAGESGEYRSQIIRAVGSDGALAIGFRMNRPRYASAFSALTTVSTLTPGQTRPPATLLPDLPDRFFYTILPSLRGYYSVSSPYSKIWSTKLTADFRIDPTYNHGDELITPLSTDYTALIPDADGRLVALAGSEIARIRG